MNSTERMYEAELLHGRWAMLGVVGAVVPEVMTMFFHIDLGEPVWWKVHYIYSFEPPITAGNTSDTKSYRCLRC